MIVFGKQLLAVDKEYLGEKGKQGLGALCKWSEDSKGQYQEGSLKHLTYSPTQWVVMPLLSRSSCDWLTARSGSANTLEISLRAKWETVMAGEWQPERGAGQRAIRGTACRIGERSRNGCEWVWKPEGRQLEKWGEDGTKKDAESKDRSALV